MLRQAQQDSSLVNWFYVYMWNILVWEMKIGYSLRPDFAPAKAGWGKQNQVMWIATILDQDMDALQGASI
jgi:hypothetical protein